MKIEENTQQQFGPAWLVALYLLTTLFVVAGGLNMAHLRVVFLTTHAADLSGPALLYIVLRRGWQKGSDRFLSRTFGRSPEVTAGVLFFGSTVTEISQIFYPRGIFSGRFDPWDIVMYGIGVGICYLLEKNKIGMVTKELKVKT